MPDVVTANTVPIRNPVTDEEVQIRLVVPEAWMFYEAEVASGTAKGTGDIKFDYSQRHSALATFAYNNNGMAHSYEEAKEMYGFLCASDKLDHGSGGYPAAGGLKLCHL